MTRTVTVLGAMPEVSAADVCAICGDPFDVTHGNLIPEWSTDHDAAAHLVCLEGVN